jgi:hypothetical protein
MNGGAKPHAAISPALHAHNWDGTTESRERTTFRVNRMRSVANIQFWRSYLPEDCVNTIIRWDGTGSDYVTPPCPQRNAE